DAHTVGLVESGARVKARHILIATGGAPNFGAHIPGLEHVISSNEAFKLHELPRRIVVQGGGYIAIEFACIFHGLGSEVTLVYRGENILRGFDNDVREHLRTEMTKRSIRVLCGHTVTGVAKTAQGLETQLSDGTKIAADRVMFAIGRKPNVEGLGLEALGIKRAEHGGIAVDAFSQTSVPHIYA